LKTERSRNSEIPRDAPGDVLRVMVIVLLVAAPLALGSVHEPAFVPLLAVGSAVGLASWARGHWRRAHGGDMPELPGRRPLLALHALVLFQLLPLPVGLLRWVSPGSFIYYDEPLLVPLTGFRPISVNPADTVRGLCFLSGMCLLYGAVFREFQETRWRRRLVAAVVGTGFVMTLAALVQAASSEPTRIYGLWKPQWDWGVFGPYVSRNHFAGYLAMAIPMSLGLAWDAVGALAIEWRHRRPAWVALGGHAGNAALRRAALAMTLVVGLLASGSRGGVMAFVLAMLALLVLLRRRRGALVLLFVLVLGLGLLWVDLGGLRQAFETRGIRQSRVVIWADALRMFPDFPVFGAGFDTFGTSYIRYQTLSRYHWYGEAHNEYLQALLDLGVVGAGLVLVLLGTLFRPALRAARANTLEAGVLGGLLACCFHNLVDFNWQIPANAANFAALAGHATAANEAAQRAALSLTPVTAPPRIAGTGTHLSGAP
jgi:O-antigen ligase